MEDDVRTQIIEFIKTGKKYDKSIVGEDQLLVNTPLVLKNFLKGYVLANGTTLKVMVAKLIYDFMISEEKKKK